MHIKYAMGRRSDDELRRAIGSAFAINLFQLFPCVTYRKRLLNQHFTFVIVVYKAEQRLLIQLMLRSVGRYSCDLLQSSHKFTLVA